MAATSGEYRVLVDLLPLRDEKGHLIKRYKKGEVVDLTTGQAEHFTRKDRLRGPAVEKLGKEDKPPVAPESKVNPATEPKK